MCAIFSLSDGCGSFPEDDPGGREDGRRRAARKNILLHDVKPPNRHTGHCTGISRYLKASCQFSSTSDDIAPLPTPHRVLNIQYCLFMALNPLLFISISYAPFVILVFLHVFDKRVVAPFCLYISPRSTPPPSLCRALVQNTDYRLGAPVLSNGEDSK